jgi:hypothetical protein
MSKVLEQIDKVLDPGNVGGIDKAGFAYEEKLFDMLLEFVQSLDPEQLTDEQLGELWKIIDSLESSEKVVEVEILKRTTPEQRKNARLYKRKSRDKIREWRNRVGKKLNHNRKQGKGVRGGMLGQSKRRDVV